MNSFRTLLLVFWTIATVCSASEYPITLTGDRGGELILASIKALGGWDTWKSKKNVQYERDGTRYEADGRVIREVQFHKLILPPEVMVRQESVSGGKRIVTAFDGSNGWITEDGKLISDANRVRGARNSSLGTQYMLCAPFKLADEGTVREYLGTVKFGNRAFYAVKVKYKPGIGDNSTHVWTYYFNQKTHFLERLDWSNAENTSHSISEYGDFRKVDGLWWPMRRTNYLKTPQGERGRKTLELVYKNLRFNNDFPPATFVRPAGTKP